MTPIAAKGYNGTVTFDGDWVTITRSGIVARTTVGVGEKRIPVGSIAAIQYKAPTALFRGFIAFTIAGGNEVKSRSGSQAASALHDENSVVLRNSHGPAMQAVREAIESEMAKRARA